MFALRIRFRLEVAPRLPFAYFGINSVASIAYLAFLVGAHRNISDDYSPFDLFIYNFSAFFDSLYRKRIYLLKCFLAIKII